MAEFVWPPEYIIRHSKRAKRINLKLCPKFGLILIIPIKSSKIAAIDFLNQQKEWVIKHQHLLQLKSQDKQLPTEIKLQALDKTWSVRYERISGYKKIKLLQLPNELVLYGENLNFENCITELKEWLYFIAERELYYWLKKLSVQYQLSFNQLSIRDQSTRWGSCSHEKNINLNFKLLFLPGEITEYILIHELCHTKHLNHSENFWQLVKSFVPNYQLLKNQLKQIHHNHFPSWI